LSVSRPGFRVAGDTECARTVWVQSVAPERRTAAWPTNHRRDEMLKEFKEFALKGNVLDMA
ncbi:MAG: hypothetical protein GTN62_12465, partial [Gemmatimonadales bacterium]|nr:hypothetical protein [Gemmatimonadales bacterium]NIP08373.1 hypothetical protein [Gemmatimonadales bacterium]